MEGGAGNVSLRGGGSVAGDDLIDGGDGDDSILGGNGDDTILAGEGDDFINAASGDDEIFGGAGNDTIVSAPGTDMVTGGAGADTFLFTGQTGLGTTIVTDFNTAEDIVDFRGFNIVNLAVSETLDGLFIENIGEATSLLLQGLGLSDFDDITFL